MDDTLVLTKPSDIEHKLNTFNTFDSQIQFTTGNKFSDNDIHFLDIQIPSKRNHCLPQTNPYWSIPTLLQPHSMVEKIS